MSDAEKSALSRMRCSEIMTRDVRTATREMTLRDVAVMMRDGDMGSVPVVEDGRLVGIVTRSDLMRSLEKDPAGNTAVLDAGTRNPVVAYEDEPIADAVARMLDRDIGRLPVVDRADPARLIGYLGRAGVLAARQKLLEEENVRER